MTEAESQRAEASGAVTRRDRALPLERAAMAAMLLGTASLYLWNLDASGWANAYYSAAALAGSLDWLAMLFGSFDAGNAITVDKTPAAVWVMSMSVRLFGFSSWSVLAPQAIMGVLAVLLTYLTVRRTFGALAGLIAGSALALTPVAALMFRFNNPDALLVLLLVAAAYATLRAVEGASTRWLVVAGVAIGFAFLDKMLQAFLIVPAVVAVYLYAAPAPLQRRLLQVGVALVAMLVSAGWYVALVELWPAGARPYIGGSQTNSMIELIFGYNGFGRITGDEVGRIGDGGGFGSAPGLLRLFDGELGTQISWLLPAALLAIVALLVAFRHRPRLDVPRAQVLLWAGWLLVTGAVFSLMQGIFHAYYSVALAPAIAALFGIGAAEAWRRRTDIVALFVAIAGLGLTVGWAGVLLSGSPQWNPWLVPVLVGATVILIAGQLVVPMGRRALVLPAAIAGGVLLVGLSTPALASLATAAEPHTGAIPSTQPAVIGGNAPGGFGRFPGGRGDGDPFSAAPGDGAFGGGPPQGFGGFPGGPGGGGLPAGGTTGRGGGLGGLLDAGQADPSLVAVLQADASAYDWIAATTGANNAAGLALSSGGSVMAIGGFNGTDPSPTLPEFQAYVADGRIHYYVGGSESRGFRGANGGSDTAAQINGWVAANFDATMIGGVPVYDLIG